MNYFFYWALLLIVLLGAGCNHSISGDPGPSSNTNQDNPANYTWIASMTAKQDTIKVNPSNNSLYLSIAPRQNNGSGTSIYSGISWNQPGFEGDFELNMDYIDVSSFMLTLIPYGDTSSVKNFAAIVSNTSASLGWGSFYALNPSLDIYNSTAGTITIKRTGSELKVTLLKNNSDTPGTQQTQETTCSTFYNGKIFLSITGISWTGLPARSTFTHFSLTDSKGNVVTDVFNDHSIYYYQY